MIEGLVRAKTGDLTGLPTTLTARRTRTARYIDNGLEHAHEIGDMFANDSAREA